MDERKQRVLQAIVDDYVRTAEPVGSRTLARKYGLGVSPATIRNEMADLELLGYLEQPHTSAGRIPSDKGYRYYVDWLLDAAAPVAGEAGLREVLAAKARRIGTLMRQAARLLAEASEFIALVAPPASGPSTLCALRVVALRDTTAVLLLVWDDGTVESRVTDLGQAIPAATLERLSQVLSERLAGYSLGELAMPGARALAEEIGGYRGVVDRVLELLGEKNDAGGDERVVLGGATNLLHQPEFRDVQKAQGLLAVLESQALLDALLDRPVARPAADGAVGVAIGHEIAVQGMAECSLVLAPFTGRGQAAGRIGVLGPRRMDYGRVMGLVEQVARAVSDLLSGSDSPPT